MTFCFRPFLIFLIIFVLENSTTHVDAFANNVTDHQALLSFKASITDDPLGALSSWNNSIHFCEWNGVTCSSRRQRVTALNLTYQHVAGTLSPHIGNLSFLRGIYLYENNFHGLIPNEIGQLLRLKELNLGYNSFRGIFPPNLSQCVDLRKLSMYSNNLQGKLPTVFTSWPRLYLLDLAKNHFTGSISPSIGNVSSLHVLHLQINNLEGHIPVEIGHLENLEYLDLSVNNLLGVVPLPLYNISSLFSVSLGINELAGTLPTDLGFTLPKLQKFYVGGNKFSGPLPPSINNASNLVDFEIVENNITGPIPNNLGSLSNLQTLGLGHNSLGESMRPNDWSFFNSLVNCTNLRRLGLHESGLRGVLPYSILNLSTTMEELYLYGNLLYGSIPREIGKLVNMRVLTLYENFLTGTIPESVGKLSKLSGLSLNNNNISGIIPTSISNITQLYGLRLQYNILQGSIPTQLFNISTMEDFSLANNRLRGVLPEEIEYFSKCHYLDVSQNLFTGPLPSKIGSLKQLAVLDLSYNKLTGDIASTLGGCVMLEELYLEGNFFQGKIPTSLKALKNLALLDLSNNNISGNIPTFFDGFHQIIFLNLSYNKLGGEVSKRGLFSNVSAFSVIGKSELCGGIQALHLDACPVKDSRNKKKSLALRIVLLLVLVPLGILSACLACICYRRRNSKKLNDHVPVLKENQHLQLSYQDLLLATNEFSPNNFLGEGRYGSVYKGVLESVEHILAVKVLNVEVHGANKSFLAECETLRNIRHRNLIKIITACSSIDFKGNDFKALVFEFMTNGSLDSWLHPSDPSHQGNERNLTLIQRLNIAIDVAQGDFVAHIGDFGLARFHFATTSDTNQTQMGSTGVHGTVGYIPPEYGMFGEISIEGDVYSYGILLLEIFSGKRPTENSILIDSIGNLHDYVKKALPQRVMDIADPRILLDHEEHGSTVSQTYSRAMMEVCLESIFEVGLLCSEEMPQSRIDISVAIRKLHIARDKLQQHRR